MVSPGDESRRFRDQHVTVWDFVGHVLVCCPRCGAMACVLTTDDVPVSTNSLFTPRRLICGACGYVAQESANGDRVRGGPERSGTVHDPFFQQPLWLQTECCGRVLWAYNSAHLELLENYVAAKLRERSRRDPGSEWERRMAVTATLPAWIKSAKNRDRVLRGLDRLRSTLET